MGLSGEFLEVDGQRRVVYTWRWDSEPSHETRVEVVFVADGNTTRIRLRHEGLQDEDEANNHHQGWNDCLDRLQELLESDHYAPGRWFNVEWDIRRDGRPWTHDEFLPRLDLTPEKMEAMDGKLFWEDNRRMVMLGLMLENLGVDAALRLGDPRVWKEAIADLERNATDSSIG